MLYVTPMSPTASSEIRRSVVAAALRRVPFFSGLSGDLLDDLAGACGRREVDRGAVLFLEGDPALGFFVILSGAVKVYRSTADGREVVIHILGPGDFIGEVPLHAGGRYPATAEAVERSSVVYVPAEALRRIVRRDPEVALRILEGFAGRLLALLGRFESLAGRSAPGRLADFLLRAAERTGRRTDDGLEVSLGLSRAQIAALLGTSRETVSRTLSAWRRAGLVALRQGTVVVRDAARLREAA